MRNISILPVILSFVLAVSGCANIGDAGSEPTASVVPPSGETQTSQRKTDAAAKTGGSDDKNEGFPIGKKGDEYILPEVKNHVYTMEELSFLTGEELRLARNEIYARYGRKFKSGDLDMYFSEKAWYRPSVAADAFDDKMLNQTESDNLKVILKAEELLASKRISCPKIGEEDFPVIDGSTATLPLSQAVYRLATGASGEEAETHIQHSKTTQAYLNLIQDQVVDLVIAYEPGERVKESLVQHGDNILLKPIGRDALVFMANEKNPVKTLTQQQVLDIYTGTLTNWKELGGKNQTIKAFQRPPSSGSQNLMEKLVMKGNDMADAPQEYVFLEMEGIIAGLASYDNTGEAMGYSVYYYAKNMYKKPELKFMGIDGVVPANDTIRNGSYPYTNDFYAAIRKDEPKDSQAYQLFEWLTSDDGQSLVNALGYVGIKDVQKLLPEGYEDSKADCPGEIPLKEGEVILGNGIYLYGESGIGVFDRKMRLQKFIRHTLWPWDNTFFICSGESVLPMLDTLSGKFGIYSIGEERWVCNPEYNRASLVEDGFELSRVTRSETGDWEYGQITYDYADSQGRLVRTGVSQEEQSLKAEASGEPDAPYVYGVKHFAQSFPEILARYHATMDDIKMYGAEDINFSVTDRDGMIHYYDDTGTLLFDFDETQLDAKASAYPTVAGRHLSYLTVTSFENEIYQYHYYLYRDGVLFKELTSKRTGWVYSYIADIKDDFYTRSIGNYLYVYNYQDELCAKFLKGMLQE